MVGYSSFPIASFGKNAEAPAASMEFGNVRIGLNGQPNHNNRRVFFQNPSGGFGPIPTRHLHIHNDNVGHQRAGQLKRLLSRRGFSDHNQVVILL